jgi:hypothetical protein
LSAPRQKAVQAIDPCKPPLARNLREEHALRTDNQFSIQPHAQALPIKFVYSGRLPLDIPFDNSDNTGYADQWQWSWTAGGPVGTLVFIIWNEPGIVADNLSSDYRARGYVFALSILAIVFSMWGFATVLNNILLPHLKAVFALNYGQSLFIQFVFYLGNLLISLGFLRFFSRCVVLVGGCDYASAGRRKSPCSIDRTGRHGTQSTQFPTGPQFCRYGISANFRRDATCFPPLAISICCSMRCVVERDRFCTKSSLAMSHLKTFPPRW